MRDPARIDRIVGKLSEVWKTVPDQRLAQLVYNAARRGTVRVDSFYVEDDLIEAELDAMLVAARHNQLK